MGTSKHKRRQGPKPKAVGRQKKTPVKKNDAQVKGVISKTDNIVALLQRPEGATIKAIMKATGWQSHSVRGFLAGTVSKKLKLKLESEKVDGERVYRIARAKKASVHAGGDKPGD